MPEAVRDHLQIASQTRSLQEVRAFITRCVTSCGVVPPEWLNRIIIAVDEAVTNIIEHAYEFDETGEIDIHIHAQEGMIEILIQDSGKSFDPGNVQKADVQDSVKRAKQGGLGVFLMRRIMDEVTYSFKENEKNELRLVKRFTRPQN